MPKHIGSGKKLRDMTPAELKMWRHEWYLKNKTRVLKKSHDWHRKNRAYANARSKKWSDTHKFPGWRNEESYNRRRQEILNLPCAAGEAGRKRRENLYGPIARGSWKCTKCGHEWWGHIKGWKDKNAGPTTCPSCNRRGTAIFQPDGGNMTYRHTTPIIKSRKHPPVIIENQPDIGTTRYTRRE